MAWRTFGQITALAAIAVVVGVMALAEDAEATHFRAGSLHAETTGILTVGGDAVLGYPATLHGEMVWRADAFTNASVGSCLGGPGALDWGDGSATSEWGLQVDDEDPATGTVLTRVMDASCQGPLRHTYLPSQDPTYTVSWSSCCRAEEGHHNNPSGGILLATQVAPETDNAAPSAHNFLASHMGVAVCAVTSPDCQVQLSASDADGDAVSFRFGSSCEADASCTFQPLSALGATLTPEGELHWNTSGEPKGLYSVHVMVGDGNTEVPIDFMVDVGSTTKNIAPIASFTWSDPVVAGQEATFTSTSTDADGRVATWEWWTFGASPAAGNRSTFTTVFDAPGSYFVSLRVQDDDGAAHSTFAEVFVLEDASPASAFGGTGTGTIWSFTDLSTDDVGITAWYWDFGDGSNSTAQHPSHRFAPGIYTVTLTVWDDRGASSTTSKSLHAPCPQTCSV